MLILGRMRHRDCYCVVVVLLYSILINIDRRHGEIMDETHVLQLIKNEHDVHKNLYNNINNTYLLRCDRFLVRSVKNHIFGIPTPL